MSQLNQPSASGAGDPAWAAEYAAMVVASGRTVDGTWYDTFLHVTINCLGHAGDEPRHDLCHGWIAPFNKVAVCRCPHHDDARPTYDEARQATQAAVDVFDRRRG